MKTQKTYRHLLIGAALLITAQGFGQASVLGHTGLPTDFLGWDGTSTNNFPVNVKHERNYPIDFYTDNTFRMRINPKLVLDPLNNFTNILAEGFTLISPNKTFLSVRNSPYSRLHLAEGAGNTSPWGYRPWQRNGITFTGNEDHGYIGHKYGAIDISDMVVQWSDNPGTFRADRMRFIFTSEYLAGTSSGMNSLEGLEGMRLWPKDANEINVGIGDFFAGGDDPTERLDVRTGKVRIRQLPTDPVSQSLEAVVVNTTTGVLEHRPFPTGGGTDCDWTLLGSPGSNSNIATAYASNPGCPQAERRVGIGTNAPLYKLHVAHNENVGSISGGLRVELKADAGGWAHGVYVNVAPVSTSNAPLFATGMFAEVNNIGSQSSGVVADGYGALSRINQTTAIYTRSLLASYADINITNGTVKATHGTRGECRISGGSVTKSYGVSGKSAVTLAGQVTDNIGVHGYAKGGSNNYSVYGQLPSGGTINWSGFFVGDISASGVAFPSDQNLKTEIQDLDNAMDLIMELHPKSYLYRQDEYPQMGLPQGQRYGFIAQEVQEVFPQFVKNSYQPADVDSLGNEITAAVDYLALNTGDITSILVGAVQHQQVQLSETASQLAEAQATNDFLSNQLEEVLDRLDALEQNLASCCEARGVMHNNGGVDVIDAKSANANDGSLRITPNPFETRTTVYYALAQSGRMQLVANSADGKQLQVLQEASLEAGSYQYEWSTSDLAPGVYYVTLLVDGQPITKRAVKILP